MSTTDINPTDVNPTDINPTGPGARLDGGDLRAMFGSALSLLERNVDAINALNVFPVPDGDTGTNMFLTLRDVVEKTGADTDASAADTAGAMARAALMGAKGNSGVILSQFFKGLAVGLEGSSDFGCEELVSCLREARAYSYKAVGEPVEGTILTVVTSAAEAASAVYSPEIVMADLLEAVCRKAREAVALTPTMLPVLREAGVVDAGGQGLAVILEGVRRHAAGEASDFEEVQAPEPIGVDRASGAVSHEFLAATDEEMYGYCTQFLVRGEGLDVDAIRETMIGMGRSAVVVGDETMVQVHVHAEDPGPAVSAAVALGTLSQVKIENMDSQHVEFSADRRQEAEAASLTTAVVAVAWGAGLEALIDNLGASRIVMGGDTMNPSVRDLLEAADRAPSDSVIILPNNGNIVPAARQAAELSAKDVAVVASRSIPQGIAALLSFDPDQELGSNRQSMEEALATVRTGEVTKAVRGVTLGGVAVEPGKLIGLLERELVLAGDDLAGVVIALLEKAAVSEGDLVTLYRGEPATDEEVDRVMRNVSAAFEGVELELVAGGQPHYHFFLSIE